MGDGESQLINDSLLARVRDGDALAANDLARELYPLVWTSVRRHIRNPSDQEDVAQEIYLKLFLKLDQFRGDQPLSHWVSRICVTSCYEHLRKRKSRPLTYQSDLSDGEIALIEATTKDAHPADAQNSRQLLVETLQKLIDALKPREQIVIRLLDIEGRSVKEACELTGWSASKVKTTAMRARRKLSESIHRIENRPRKNS